jgi:hypothetical protein
MNIVYLTKAKHELELIWGGHQVIKNEYEGLYNIQMILEKKLK